VVTNGQKLISLENPVFIGKTNENAGETGEIRASPGLSLFCPQFKDALRGLLQTPPPDAKKGKK